MPTYQSHEQCCVFIVGLLATDMLADDMLRRGRGDLGACHLSLWVPNHSGVLRSIQLICLCHGGGSRFPHNSQPLSVPFPSNWCKEAEDSSGKVLTGMARRHSEEASLVVHAKMQS